MINLCCRLTWKPIRIKVILFSNSQETKTFRKSTTTWILATGVILGVPLAADMIQPQVVKTQVKLSEIREFAQAKPLYRQALSIVNQRFRRLSPTQEQVSQKISQPYYTEGLKLLSKSCLDAVLKIDQQVARWIEEDIRQWTPKERREADLEYVRRRIITFKDSTLSMSNPQAIFGSPSSQKTEQGRYTGYIKISQSLASACPEVNSFFFTSAGSYFRWTMRRTNFSIVYDRFTVILDNNALVGLESCQKCELDSFIDYFSPVSSDISALLPREDIVTFDAKGKFLGLPVVAVLTRECQEIQYPDGTFSCRYAPVQGVVFSTPFDKAYDHLAKRYNLATFKAQLLPDPTNKNRSVLICLSNK